jgi:hypothetical protein
MVAPPAGARAGTLPSRSGARLRRAPVAARGSAWLLVGLSLLVSCAPVRSAPRAPLTAVVISDLNEAYGTIGYSDEVLAVVRRIATEWRPDVVIAAGDLIAGQAPALPDSTVRAMWRHFDLQVREPLRKAGIPLIAALGNHDASAYPAHERDRRLAVEYWRAPGRPRPEGLVDGAGYPLRFTVRHRDVFFAVWDGTNQESGRDPAQLEWLREALRSPEARSAAHVVVVSHLPLYPVARGRDRPGEFLANGDSLRRELEHLGATLFVSGHHHAFFPGRRGALELLYSGALGSGPRPLIGRADPRRSIALVEFAADSLRIRPFEVLDGGEVRLIPTATLPAVICSGQHRVVRRDLVEADPPCASPDPPIGAGDPAVVTPRAAEVR